MGQMAPLPGSSPLSTREGKRASAGFVSALNPVFHGMKRLKTRDEKRSNLRPLASLNFEIRFCASDLEFSMVFHSQGRKDRGE
ncbi:MAG: hypothetical protein A2170_04970 [Deltaproteobacteria bacterium RBG_13_53_10]|nr:MAG: hypothetical protein A2170_04970 [Deltaproteobacteria bacterium RBG_13_53_10]